MQNDSVIGFNHELENLELFQPKKSYEAFTLVLSSMVKYNKSSEKTCQEFKMTGRN